MTNRTALAICAALLALGVSQTASAQDAAETAAILSGTGQGTGGASRSMGSSVSNSMNSATNALRSVQSSRKGQSRRSSRSARQSYAIPADADLLEGTEAPTYQLGNGSSIRVSGGLVPDATTSCVKNCAGDKAD